LFIPGSFERVEEVKIGLVYASFGEVTMLIRRQDNDFGENL